MSQGERAPFTGPPRHKPTLRDAGRCPAHEYPCQRSPGSRAREGIGPQFRPTVHAKSNDVLTRQQRVSGHAFQAAIYESSDYERRVRFRHAAVNAVTRSREYAAAHQKMRTGTVERPATPDPTDRSVSKRAWERKEQSWRMSLQFLAHGYPHLLLPHP